MTTYDDRVWLVYWHDAQTGRFRQQQHHSVSAARATAEAVTRSGRATEHGVTMEYRKPYSLSRA